MVLAVHRLVMRVLLAVLALIALAQCAVDKDAVADRAVDHAEWLGPYTMFIGYSAHDLNLFADGTYRADLAECTGFSVEQGHWRVTANGVELIPEEGTESSSFHKGVYPMIIRNGVHFLLTPKLDPLQMKSDDFYYSSFVKDSDGSPKRAFDRLRDQFAYLDEASH